MDACLEKGTALHLYGLLSNGGVHSTVEHVWALLKMAGIKGLKRVYLHCFLDGRDVSPTSGADFVAEAQKVRRPRRRQDRDRHGPLLRHGPRQALGPS